MPPAVPPSSFYQASPDDLAGPAGSLIASLELAAPPGIRGWAILYRSLGTRDEPIGVSGLVAVAEPTDPTTGSPVLGWGHGTTGIADSCAPSRLGLLAPEMGPLVELARLGFVVTATDYEGLGTPGLHPYLVGVSEGRSLLDSIRAVRQIHGVDADEAAVLVGISQGGHAVLWAAELAPDYAPEIKLRGAVAASPPIDLTAVRHELMTGPTWGPDGWLDSLLATAAWSDAYGLELDGLVTPEATRVIEGLRERCPWEVEPPTVDPFVIDIAEAPGWESLLEANSPGHAPSAAPLLVLAASADEIILPATIPIGIERLERAGSNVELRWIEGGHTASLENPDGAAAALAWTLERIASPT